MKDIYNICFYGGLTLAIVFLIVSIVLFAVFKIPKVIGDLTGRNARKEIAEKQKKKGGTEKSDSSKILKQEQKKYYNQDTGKITIRDSATNEDETVKITSDAKSPRVMPEERETDILRPGDEDDIPTDVLNKKTGGEEETTILGGSDSEAETDVLRPEGSKDSDDAFDPDGETDVLRAPDSDERNNSGDDFDPDGETDVLRAPDSDEDEEATDVLRASDDEEATTVLAGGKDEKDNAVLSTEKIDDTKNDDRVIYSVVIVHTEESL